jgi:hypothetical protein
MGRGIAPRPTQPTHVPSGFCALWGMEVVRRVIDKRNKEKFQIDDAYLNGWAKRCGINATGVYMVLCRHASKDQECFPSKKLIAEKLAISERSVYNAIKILEAHNIIEVHYQGRKEDGTYQNLTYILLDKTTWKAPSAPGAE